MWTPCGTHDAQESLALDPSNSQCHYRLGILLAEQFNDVEVLALNVK